MVETRQGSELEDSMRSTEELLEREQRYGSLLETEKNKSTGTTNKVGHLHHHHHHHKLTLSVHVVVF